MNFKDAKEVCESFNKHRLKTILILIILVVIIVCIAYLQSYFGEKGKQHAGSTVQIEKSITPSKKEPEKIKHINQSKTTSKVIQHTEGDQSPTQNIGSGGIGIIEYHNCPQEKPSPEAIRKGKPKLPPTTAELEKNLREQIIFLRISATNFDKCLLESEGKRMAANLYILFVDTENEPSLLGQMRIRDKILLPNTAHKDMKGNLAPYTPLVVMTFGGGRHTPYLARGLSPMQSPPHHIENLQFDKWWQTVIIDDHKGVVFTRETLVKSVALQDGGIKVASVVRPTLLYIC